MDSSKTLSQNIASLGIALLCFGYFASYVPYSMMTKMVTTGLFTGMEGKSVTGFEIGPITVLASFISMYIFITAKGWWQYCTHSKFLGVSFPRPQWFTFLSGLCTAGQIITTTLAYTFSGISIVFAMLLMRGGVLILAPIVDLAVKKRKRKIYWPSLVASGLSLAALFVAFSSSGSTSLTYIAAADIAIYLFGYFFRLFIMSGRAKSDDAEERKRYFAEEQMVANPTLLIVLFIIGFLGRTAAADTMAYQFWTGFTSIPIVTSKIFVDFLGAQIPLAIVIFLIGVFSYGTGLFGSLIFLDKRENTFTVPANRASSILSGVLASYLLYFFFDTRTLNANELVGSLLIICAILFLMYRAVVEKRKVAVKEKKTPLVEKKKKPSFELRPVEGE